MSGWFLCVQVKGGCQCYEHQWSDARSGSEEELIVAVKAVASSTAQLLVPCQVKDDARSENNRYILTQYQMLIR